MKQGYFITFEGGDGAGKSTQINILKDELTAAGYDVILTREPGGTQISEKIRELILDPANGEMDDMTEAFLYAAARAQIVRELIKPALAEGKVVICDRFVDSSIAYQAFGRGLGDAIGVINTYAVDGCMPDMTILLRLDPEKGSRRIADREHDRIEQASDAFHRKVYEGYLKLEEMYPDRIVGIDASGTINEIAEEISGKVKEMMSRG
ncbi:MAG: dTMP kinase [Clostridiales bacterium]|nr:dTMP kinase [Clostridiales bacterium]MBQ3322433.1 dTMP kinase [Bacillota bacterium]